LQSYPDIVDSIYNTRAELKKIVLRKEEDKHKNFCRLKRAKQLKSEANELERRLNKVEKAKAPKYFHPGS